MRNGHGRALRRSDIPLHLRVGLSQAEKIEKRNLVQGRGVAEFWGSYD
jgi:hypothetical protein